MHGTFRLPLIPIFLIYTLGIAFGHVGPHLPIQESMLFLLLFLGGWAFLLTLKKTRTGSWVAFFVFFFLGIFSIQLYLHPPPSPSPITRFIDLDRVSLEGIIDRPTERFQGRTQLLIRSQKVIQSNHHIPVRGFILIFLKGYDHELKLGDRLRILCKLFPPHGFHNPGGFSYERHLAFKRIHTIGFLCEEKSLVKTGEGYKHSFHLQMEHWRDQIRQFLEREASPLSSGIAKALVLGEQGDIPEEIKEQFIVTGIAHLLAISGDHLGIVAFLSFSLMSWILKRSEYLLLTLNIKKWAATLTIPSLLLYTLIAGGGISVIRATIMVITFFFSILFQRERNLLHALALAAFLILLASPPSLFDVSFQLSFIAVLSILYLVPRILHQLKREDSFLLTKPSWKNKMIRYIMLSLLVTGVAIWGTAPLVAFHFNRFSVIGFFTNLLFIPWVGFFIVPLNLLASLFSFFFYPFATLLIQLSDWMTLALLKLVAFFASIPYASFYISTPTLFEMILFYLLLVLTAYLKKGKKVRYLFIGLCAVFILNLAFWNLKDLFQKDLRLTFIDVGHGDSMLIEFPRGKKMLIDGGGRFDDRFDIGKNVVGPFLWKKKIRRIDTLILTHPDPDHLKGLNFIASHFSIGQFWDNGFQVESEPSLQLRNILAERKIKTQSLNDETPLQIIHGVEISILNPPLWKPTQKAAKNFLGLNNASLVMKLRFKNISVLLTGDIESEAEARLLRKDVSLKADILKVPHHGSSSSSSPPFLERVRPTYAILSVGKRNLGKLPHPEVLRRYGQLGSSIFRTDEHGAIMVRTDGKNIKVDTFRKAEF
ncbi:MAG: DNA internalization-related competence protein ComEC/Rec2 [Syntrophaceae bacterium]|nr:DNA internalization-related competence protein ComEC/Rec2 [Syntrophaceae bacterium]